MHVQSDVDAIIRAASCSMHARTNVKKEKEN
jgi:hypothetical protein